MRRHWCRALHTWATASRRAGEGFWKQMRGRVSIRHQTLADLVVCPSTLPAPFLRSCAILYYPPTCSTEHVEVQYHGQRYIYKVLATLEFNSDRKRMSIICRWGPCGRLISAHSWFISACFVPAASMAQRQPGVATNELSARFRMLSCAMPYYVHMQVPGRQDQAVLQGRRHHDHGTHPARGAAQLRAHTPGACLLWISSRVQGCLSFAPWERIV